MIVDAHMHIWNHIDGASERIAPAPLKTGGLHRASARYR